jgi:cell division protease FtsH
MNDKAPNRGFRWSRTTIIVVLALFLLVPRLLAGLFAAPGDEVTYSEFKTALRAGEVVSVRVSDDRITGEMSGDRAFSVVRVEDPGLLAELDGGGVAIEGVASGTNPILALLGWLLPVALIIGFYYWMFRRMRGAGGATGGALSFGKSKARVVTGEQTGVTFDDVGGAGEALVELREVTEFLTSPERFQRLGGKMPRGVLLLGPPGTGKTLLAKATAGEAGVPFFSLSASEFVEMFVGVGASRVRDLFDQAKKSSPSIVFIDEIDAIGGRRSGQGAVGTHEEREQTLNQLLSEMDGFEPKHNVIVMAATNRPEVLDAALLRPGRFDRQITVDLPDVAGREQILGIHTRGVPLASGTRLSTIAGITSGFSGADLANVVNEAALMAARGLKSVVDVHDFEAAIERIVAGSERRTRTMSATEKRVVAVHEAGHALVASLLPGTDPVHKVTIVPRGRALGYTWQRPLADRYLMSEGELRSRLAVLLGGRAAEALSFDEVSTGAVDDLARATDLARRMATEYGMSPALGPVRLAAEPQAQYLGLRSGLDTRVSPQTATQVDLETRRIVEAALSTAWELLEAHRGALDRLAASLCERETVSGAEVVAALTHAPTGPVALPA